MFSQYTWNLAFDFIALIPGGQHVACGRLGALALLVHKLCIPIVISSLQMTILPFYLGKSEIFQQDLSFQASVCVNTENTQFFSFVVFFVTGGW